MEPNDPGLWVKLVGDNGAMVVITGIAIMLATWGVIKLFGLFQWGFNKLLGDGGFVERLVTGHTNFLDKIAEGQEQANQQIKLLSDKTEEIRTANLSEALVTSTLQKHFKDSHDFNIAVIETGVEMAEKASVKAGMGDELQEYIEKIRYLIASKSALRHSDSIHA